MDLAASAPEQSELYLPGRYERRHLPAMLSAKPWRAYWNRQDESARAEHKREMILDAPGLSAGVPVHYEVLQRVDGSASPHCEDGQTSSLGNEARLSFEDWYDPEFATGAGTERTVFPKVEFQFVATGGGRTKASDWLAYDDFLDVTFTHTSTSEPIANTDVVVHSPWGRLVTTSSPEGRVFVEHLPPGGARALMDEFGLEVGHEGAGELEALPALPPDTSNDHAIRIEVVNENGEAVDDEEYRLTLPDGTETTGVVTKGEILLTGIADGSCSLSFPNRGDEEWAVDLGPPLNPDGSNAMSESEEV